MLVVCDAQLNTKIIHIKYNITFFICLGRIPLDMSIKKIVIIIVSCFTLVSCASFDPKNHPTGFQSINDVSIKDKNSSKIYIVHQPYEFPGLPIKAEVYLDDKKIGRTMPALLLVQETNKQKIRMDVYGAWCSTEYKDYGSAKLNIDLKQGEDAYVVIREKRTAFEVPVGGTIIHAALMYGFCKNVESDKSAFHELRKISKEAWTEISKTKNSAGNGYTYKDEELKAAREYLLKENK